jgi:endogenous inhibitor of DNA gyrase (YacG/DUF329 family)
VLESQLMFAILLCYSFPYTFIQIHHRPFCFGRNLQLLIGLWDERCKASRLFLPIILDVNLLCIWESRINELVLESQLMFAILLCYSFPYTFVQIHHRPFCCGRNLQFHIGLWDESVRLHALSMVYLSFLYTALSPVFSSKSTKGHYA